MISLKIIKPENSYPLLKCILTKKIKKTKKKQVAQDKDIKVVEIDDQSNEGEKKSRHVYLKEDEI